MLNETTQADIEVLLTMLGFSYHNESNNHITWRRNKLERNKAMFVNFKLDGTGFIYNPGDKPDEYFISFHNLSILIVKLEKKDLQ